MSASELADALEERLVELASAFFTQAVVQPGATDQYVIVDVAGSEVRCPYLQTYRPRSGDVVWLAGPPGSWVCLGTISGIRDLAGLMVNANLDVHAGRDVLADRSVGAQLNLNAAVDVNAGGTVNGAYMLSTGDIRATRDSFAGRSVGAGLNVVASFDVIDRLGNVRTAGGSVPEVKTDVEPIDPHEALAALAKLDYATWRYIGDFVSDGSAHGELRRFAGPMMTSTFTEDPLLQTVIRYGLDDQPDTFDIQSLLGLVAAALPAIRVNLDEQLAALAPLKRTADQLPEIVAHSDQVHTELQQGLDAIRTAVGAVQQAAGSLGTSLTPIAQLAAQAQAQAAIAAAAASAAGQRCAALEARVDTLEARKVRTWRAAGNLPTLALNATTPVTCPWTSAVPTPLPNVDQCQVFVAGSAIPTVTAVGATGVTVSLKAAAALLPAPGAVQIMAVTW